MFVLWPGLNQMAEDVASSLKTTATPLYVLSVALAQIIMEYGFFSPKNIHDVQTCLLLLPGSQLISERHQKSQYSSACFFCGLDSENAGKCCFFPSKSLSSMRHICPSARLSTHISTPPKLQTCRQMFLLWPGLKKCWKILSLLSKTLSMTRHG